MATLHTVTRCIVLDLGQVLASPADQYTAPAEFLGVDPQLFAEHYWTDRRAYDSGLDNAAYWEPFLDRLGVLPTDTVIEQLALTDARLWTELRPTALELLRTVRGWDLPLVLLSNAPRPLGRAVRRADWAQLFDHIVISAELGITKPDPAIYATVTAAVGVDAGEIAFIDDRAANVEAARDCGWQAHLWVDDADSLAWLRAVCGR